jgi:hypothetical protein
MQRGVEIAAQHMSVHVKADMAGQGGTRLLLQHWQHWRVLCCLLCSQSDSILEVHARRRYESREQRSAVASEATCEYTVRTQKVVSLIGRGIDARMLYPF